MMRAEAYLGFNENPPRLKPGAYCSQHNGKQSRAPVEQSRHRGTALAALRHVLQHHREYIRILFACSEGISEEDDN
jgi:hypothetical protein